MDVGRTKTLDFFFLKFPVKVGICIKMFYIFLIILQRQILLTFVYIYELALGPSIFLEASFFCSCLVCGGSNFKNAVSYIVDSWAITAASAAAEFNKHTWWQRSWYEVEVAVLVAEEEVVGKLATLLALKEEKNRPIVWGKRFEVRGIESYFSEDYKGL